MREFYVRKKGRMYFKDKQTNLLTINLNYSIINKYNQGKRTSLKGSVRIDLESCRR